jgi:putative hydrolase of the HAD superfamily
MNDRWPVHTVVFDLDDTLYLEREFVLSGFAAAGRWLKKEHKITGFAERAGRLFAEGARGHIFDSALAELGHEPASSLIESLVAIYREHEPALTLLPDAAAALAWAGRPFRLGLITDGYAAVQARKIRALGLEAQIPCRIVTDEWGRAFWKPSPEPYRRLMEHFPGSADGYLYIGDNPHKDFLAPRELGWRTLRIRRPGGEHAGHTAAPHQDAERDIASLRELEELIQPSPAIGR